MNIISYFYQILEENFKNYLKKYFNTLDYTDKISKEKVFITIFIKIISSFKSYLTKESENSSFIETFRFTKGFSIRRMEEHLIHIFKIESNSIRHKRIIKGV